MHLWHKIGIGSLVLASLLGCSDTSKYASASREGADTALTEVALRYRAAQAQPLLAPAGEPDVCGATGHYTQYGTVHVRGGFANGMWTPAHEVPVVYRGAVVPRTCPQ